MWTSLWLLVAATGSVRARSMVHKYDDTLYHFKSRPDIKAPKYEVEVYNKSAIAPGYWVLGPYEALDLKEEVLDGWIGPAIYDSEGMLVYSGAPTFGNGNTEDFKLSSVGGEEMFTLMDQQQQKGVLMDKHYNVKKRMEVSGKGVMFNSHEFNFVENGTKALVIDNDYGEASDEESAYVGYKGQCRRACNGITEYDTTTWKTMWQWSSCGNIHLNESTADKSSIRWLCHHVWDYVHANSIDKTPEGDYLLSCRHTDAIYKISAETKKIIWRLGGKHSDFKMIDNLNFTRQHDIRFRGYNGTHTIVSLLDNAVGEDQQSPSGPFSRGLSLALDVKSDPMTAQIIAQYDHPEGAGHYSVKRGNLQVLSNGNVLMGWSERGQISEHLHDGTIVMRAYLSPRWLGTYRSYKFEYQGWPSSRPDAASEAVDVNYGGGTKTNVYASWNGATEVSEWSFYKTNPLGESEVSLGSVKKNGFETSLTYDGFAKYVVVEAVHANGTILGRSGVAITALEDDSTDAVQEEEDWQQEHTPLLWRIVHSPWFIGSLYAIIGIATLLLVRKLYAARPESWTVRRAVASFSRLNNIHETERNSPKRPTAFSGMRYRANSGNDGRASRAPLMSEKERRHSTASDDSYWLDDEDL